jgi:HEAT repeat protein
MVVELLRHFGPPEALDFYIECVLAHPSELGDELSESIVVQGERAVEPLLSAYEEVGEEEGHEIAFLLATIGVRDSRILELLLNRLEYDAGDAAFCLGIYGDPAAKPALEEILKQIPEEEPEFRHQFQTAIAELRPAGEPAQPEPFDILSRYPAEEPPMFDLMNEEERLDMLNSDVAEYRTEAAASFFNEDLSDEARERLFDVARADSDPNVRARCWEALAGWVLDRKDIRDAMVEVVADERNPVEERGGALVGLYPALSDHDVRPLAESMYQMGGHGRVKAMEAMSRSLEKAYAKFFPQHLDDPDPAVQEQAILGVGYLGIVGSAGRLRDFFSDTEKRPDALFAYAMCVPAELSKGRIPGLFRKIEKDAGGLDDSEVEIVETALDQRLMIQGMQPYFHTQHDHDHEE